MGQILTVFPAQPSFRQTVTLGELQFSLRLTWRHRLQAWYGDLFAANGDEIWLGQRVSPGWGLSLGLNPDGQPDGPMLIRGPGDYNRSDFGSTVEIVFYTNAEIEAVQAAAATAEDAIVVTIP